MRILITIITLVVTLMTTTACSPVTIRNDDKPKNYQAASYQKNVSYWWWGLSGEHNINVREACKGLPIDQVQATSTFTDALAYVFTLGIYMPRTAKVWCKQSSAASNSNGGNL
jgi:hypothetical protein